MHGRHCVWVCPKCAMQNFTDSLFNEVDSVSTTNSFGTVANNENHTTINPTCKNTSVDILSSTSVNGKIAATTTTITGIAARPYSNKKK